MLRTNFETAESRAMVASVAPVSEMALEILDRETGQWKALRAKDGRYAFELRPGGGELVRVHGRLKQGPPH